MPNVAEILISARQDFLKATQAAKRELQDLGKSGEESGRKIETGGHAAHKSMAEARETARGLSEIIGVHLPKSVVQFLAHSQAIGPALAGAFSVVAVVQLLGVLGELPEVFRKIEGAITGWDEKAKKAYDHFLEENKKAIEAAEEFKLKMIEIQSGSAASLEQSIKDTTENLQKYQRVVAELETRIHGVTPAAKANVELSQQTGVLVVPESEPTSPTKEDLENLDKYKQLITETSTALAALISKRKTATESLLDPINKDKIAEEELAKAIQLAQAQHFSATTIAYAYAGQLEAVAKKADFEKKAVSELFAPYIVLLNTRKAEIADLAVLNANRDAQTKKYLEQTQAIVDVTVAYDHYLEVMAALPKRLTEVNFGLISVNANIAKQEELLRSRPIAALNIPLAKPIPGTGINAGILNQMPINPNLGPASEDDWKRWMARGESVINDISGSIKTLFLDSISHGKNFWDAFKDLGKNAIASIASFFMDTFLKGLLNPFKAIIGRGVEGLSGKLIGAGAGALGLFGGSAVAAGTVGGVTAATGIGATGATAMGLGGIGGIAAGSHAAMTSLMAFATNPVTIGVAAAIGGALILKHFLGHKTQEAAFTTDPYTNRPERTFFFNTNPFGARGLEGGGSAGDRLSDGIDRLNRNLETLEGVPADSFLKKKMIGLYATDNEFRRTSAGKLADELT